MKGGARPGGFREVELLRFRPLLFGAHLTREEVMLDLPVANGALCRKSLFYGCRRFHLRLAYLRSRAL